MIVKWLREHVSASAILAVLRLYLGYHWITGGWGKITGGFDSTGYLQGAIAKATGEHPAVSGWWAAFLEGFALPNAGLFNILVPWGEFLVGIALILGIFTTFAALMGAVMNFAFMFSGTTSTNPQMVLVAFLILVAGANAGKIGGDYYVLPYFRKLIKHEKVEKTITTH
ncbi:DoxX family protein [Fredinandcohnia humi]